MTPSNRQWTCTSFCNGAAFSRWIFSRSASDGILIANIPIAPFESTFHRYPPVWFENDYVTKSEHGYTTAIGDQLKESVGSANQNIFLHKYESEVIGIDKTTLMRQKCHRYFEERNELIAESEDPQEMPPTARAAHFMDYAYVPATSAIENAKCWKLS